MEPTLLLFNCKILLDSLYSLYLVLLIIIIIKKKLLKMLVFKKALKQVSAIENYCNSIN